MQVRGLWGTMPWSRWAAAAERAGNVLLAMQSDWLIVVGGVSSNNDLSDVRNRPIVLDVDDRVVYEAHVYSWSGTFWLSTYSPPMLGIASTLLSHLGPACTALLTTSQV